MAITENTYTGDGSTVLFSFTFEYIAESDIKITLDGTPTTAYTLANATTIQFNTAPANGVDIRIYRDTNIDTLSAEFFPGSAIKAEDLNTNFTQNLYVTQEVNNNAVQSDDSTPFVNDISMGGYKITNLADPVADTDAVNRAYVNNVVATGIGDGDKGDIVVSGSGSTFTIDSGAVTDAKVDGSAAIQSTKLAFTQSGTDATTRTVESKLRDVVSVKDFGAVGDGITDDTAAIQAAINAAGARGGGIVYLEADALYRITAKLSIGSGGSGSASTYQNVELIGLGAAPLAASSSATQIIWDGPTSDSSIMVEVAGRMTGGGVSNVYLNANSKAGVCLSIKSNVLGRFSQLLGSNFRSAGLELTVQDAAPLASWYSTTNYFERCFFTSSVEGSIAYKLNGKVENGISNGPHRNTFVGCIGSVPRTLDLTKTWPSALYLGYTDSNTFIECDFQLNGISSPVTFVNDRDALAALNGASYASGDNIYVRYFGNTVGGVKSDIRHVYYYQYSASSTATDDGVDVIEPADSVGRFLRYQGSCVALDATVKDNWPVNNFFYGCAFIRNPSVEDITSPASGNALGFFGGQPAIKLTNHTTADAENIPPQLAVYGDTDSCIYFGGQPRDFRGDTLPIILSQKNDARRASLYLNTNSTTKSASNHFGFVLKFEERSNDLDSWVESGRFTVARDGSPVLPLVNSSPALLQPGRIIRADGLTYDPLNINTPGARKQYLAYHDGSSHQPLVPGHYVINFIVGIDDFKSISFPGGVTNGFVEVCAPDSTGVYGCAYMACGVAGVSSAVADTITAGSTLAFKNFALTGANGDAGKVNVAVDPDGNLYVNNRDIFVRKVTLHVKVPIQTP